MDVRCEKCQTEYELDESRLKPGGVTVKCTNCGHMFKIRRRATTNVGIASAPSTPSAPVSTTANTAVGPRPSDSDAPLRVSDPGSGPTTERQWMVRLDNGETRTCRELASLQQWIVAGIVSRESLISRSGKTWKRLGDIPELGQYFVIAEEARTKRSHKPTSKPGGATILGVGTHDEDPTAHYRAAQERAATPQVTRPATSNPEPRAARASTPTPPPPPARPVTAPPASKPSPTAQTELQTGPIPGPAGPAAPAAPRRPATQPPPAPRKVPDAGRATAAWASNEIKPSESMTEMPQGPRSGKLAAIPNEPAFAGRVRIAPSEDVGFNSGKLPITEEDDDSPLEHHRGSRAGTYLAILSLLVIGGAAGVVYLTLFRAPHQAAPAAKQDAAAVATAPIIDAAAAKPAADAAPAAPADPLAQPKAELLADVGARLDAAAQQLADKTDPPALALRARLIAAHAQGLVDSTRLVEHAAAAQLKKQIQQLAIQAAPLAQRALKGAPDDAAANLAMADVLRLQGKPAREVARYLDAAKAKAGSDAELQRSVALATAQLAMRDGKLDDAQKALTGVDAPDDMRVKLAAALVALAQNRAQDAKPLVDQILATQPDQEVAKQLSAKLATLVAKTDPMPAEDHGQAPAHGPVHPVEAADYDSLRKRADQLAQTNCTAAKDLYRRALEQKPNGVEALTGMAYCELDAKDFASAYREFSTALVVSTNYEPALAGIAETYQQQGNKAKAIDAWHKYLGVYPGSMKAKRQLELLGEGDTPAPAPPGGDSGGSTSSGAGSAASAPAPSPAPAPAPSSGDSAPASPAAPAAPAAGSDQ